MTAVTSSNDLLVSSDPNDALIFNFGYVFLDLSIISHCHQWKRCIDIWCHLYISILGSQNLINVCYVVPLEVSWQTDIQTNGP